MHQRVGCPQREMIHFYGALEVQLGREIAIPALEQTNTVTSNFIRLLLLHFPTHHILLLLDRAPWHFGPEIHQLLSKNNRLALMYFPVACPDLNPHEHVWERTRDAISHNHSYRSFETLLADFETYLNETLFACDFIEQYGPPTNNLKLIYPLDSVKKRFENGIKNCKRDSKPSRSARNN